MSDGYDQILDAMAAESARRVWDIEDRRLANEAKEDDEEVDVSEFGSEREVQLGACPICGQATQYVHASLLEVKVSCYCSPTSSINVLAETEAEAFARWNEISAVFPALAWNPVRYVPPPAGRLLVTVLHDGKPVVSIAKWDGQAWMPATPVIAWAPLPEAWS